MLYLCYSGRHVVRETSLCLQYVEDFTYYYMCNMSGLYNKTVGTRKATESTSRSQSRRAGTKYWERTVLRKD
jgi:hypothetical protein